MARYIDADALINNILTEYGIDPKYCASRDVDGIKAYTDSLILERINAQPTADVAEVWHGEWYRPREWTTKTYRRLCTNCQDVAYYCGAGDYKFCPNCGARMDVERRDDGEIY